VCRWGFAAASGHRSYMFASSEDVFATGGTVPVRAIAMPLWFVTMLFAIAPAARFFRAVSRHRRERKGLCEVCGYDLRATPDRCPECGKVPEKVTS